MTHICKTFCEIAQFLAAQSLYSVHDVKQAAPIDSNNAGDGTVGYHLGIQVDMATFWTQKSREKGPSSGIQLTKNGMKINNNLCLWSGSSLGVMWTFSEEITKSHRKKTATAAVGTPKPTLDLPRKHQENSFKNPTFWRVIQLEAHLLTRNTVVVFVRLFRGGWFFFKGFHA